MFTYGFGAGPSLSPDGRSLGYNEFFGGELVIASVETGDRVGLGTGGSPSLSFDGRHVAFSSFARVPEDTNGASDIYVTDVDTGDLVRASTAADGTEANGDSSRPVLSWDGRYVAFESEASNLVAGDTNGEKDIFVKDLTTGAIARASTAADGSQANGESFAPVLSADGLSVAFRSEATNLVDGDTNGVADIFVKDLADAFAGDTVLGTDGADSLAGTLNDDTISGLGGDDTIDGLAGNDSLLGDGDADRVSGGDGFDTLLGGAGGDRLDGGGDGDTLDGGEGDDALVGGAGNDRLIHGPGNDTYDGGAGDDTLAFDAAIGGVTFDLGSESNVIGIENIVGGAGGDTLRGGGGADTLQGRGGADTLIDAAGDDRLDGGADDDRLIAGPGIDTFEGGTGDDTLDFGATTAGVAVDLGAGSASGSETGADAVRGIEDVVGGAGDDSLTGDDGDNTLDGGAGDDTLEGASGNDTLVGGDGNDTAAFADDTAGVSVDLASGSASGDASGTDSLAGIEGIAGGAGGDTLTGDAAANRIEGAGGNDGIDGGGGDDTLLGGGGDDTLVDAGGDDGLNGGDGDDSIIAGAGDDTYEGGEGSDILSFAGTVDGVAADLAAETASGAQTGEDRVRGFERMMGGDGGDALSGDAGANAIDGGAGNDTLIGRTGGDTLVGGDGDDRLFGDGGTGNRVNLQVRFDREDAVFRSTYGYYDTETGEARILVANTDPDTNPALFGFSTILNLSLDQFEHLGFFLIPDGFNLNGDAGEPLAGDDFTALDLEVFEGGDGWRVRDTDTGHEFEGAYNPAYFTEDAKNRDGIDQVMEMGDLTSGGGVAQAWEDLPVWGDRDFNDVVFRLRLASDAPGDDLLIGDAGRDTVFLAAAVRGVAVDLAAGTASGADIGQDTLEGVENVIGGGGDDTLSGDEQANDIDGGAGNDRVEADAGNDTYEGGAGDDILSFAGAPIAVTVDLGAGTAVGPATGEDRFSGFETVIGGGGEDTLSYEGDTAGVTVDMLAGTAFGVESGIVGVEGFEAVAGGEGNDTLIGGIGGDRFEGGGGKDILRGGSGADTLGGGDGDDTLAGGNGPDRLSGGGGNDVFAYDAVWESPPNAVRDEIGDFDNPGPADGDRIDVSDIAAFAFIGTDTFSGGGAELRVEQAGVNARVAGDANGDGVADFEIQVTGTMADAFTAEDFVLA